MATPLGFTAVGIGWWVGQIDARAGTAPLAQIAGVTDQRRLRFVAVVAEV